MQLECTRCGAPFITRPSKVAKGHGRFCSKACRGAAVTESLPEKLTEARFWSRAALVGDCWEWMRNRHRQGYGYFRTAERKYVLAHRYAYELIHGPIPDGLAVLHECDNPPCVNPAHLFLGTQLDNIEDMHRKHRAVALKGEGHPNAKLTEDAVREIRRHWAAGGVTRPVLAAQYGITPAMVGFIVHRRSWKHVT